MVVITFPFVLIADLITTICGYGFGELIKFYWNGAE